MCFPITWFKTKLAEAVDAEAVDKESWEAALRDAADEVMDQLHGDGAADKLDVG